ncbi:hypothetical protein R4J18_04800 [Brachyspira pilosicoli]|uniref:hypothetical protein n=1 Tax=Brachyspira pilosicoli TaxID=52584 RepID=UPI003004921A
MDTENCNIFANVIIPILTTLITSSVTIVGLFINNKSIKKKFENEIKKTKSDLMIDKMSIAIEYILDVRNLSLKYTEVKDEKIKKAIENESKIKTELFNKIVYAFGSFDAITILESINKERKCNTSLYNILCLYQLLIVQIKYDLTDVVISSISWFEVILKDYQKQEKNIIETVNALVDELNLNLKFKISK